MRYDDASQTGSSAADNAPVARPDVDAIAPGSFSPATGNAITGAGTTSGLAGADAPANGSRIVEVHGAGGPTAGAGSAFQASGQYGVLNMDAQGNFTYVRNPGTPDGVQDVFGYTLADAKGATSSTTLTMDIGGIASAAATAATQGIVNLPAGVEMSDIKVNGRDLVIQMPDGTQMVIPGGAVFVPQLVIGDVQVPSSNLAALLIDSEPKPAAGSLQSSGGNFDVPVPPLDPGVPLGDLIPPTELAFTPPEVREVNQFIDEDVDAGTSFAQLDDDAQAGGIAGGVGDDPGGSTAAGFLPGSNGDGDLQWALLSSGAPAGFSYQDGPDGSVLVFQDGNANAVLRIDIDPDTGAYTVTQLGPIAHPAGGDENNIEIVINYTVTDEDGDDDTGSLTINIDDDTPVARNDTDAIVGKETSTDGNVITGVGTTSGSAGADSPGADGLGAPGNPNDGVTGVHAGTSGAFVAPGTPIVGLFGTLVMDADGHYVYTRAEGVRTGGTDVFTYRIIDGDGDETTATLTITVPADPVPQPNAATAIVDDDGLPAGNHDSQPGDDVVPDNDGDNDESTFRGTLTANFGTDAPGTFNFSAMNLIANSTGTVGQETVHYSWDAGTRILTATITASPDASRIGTDLFQVHLDAGGQFDVTLLQNVLQINDGTNTENNASAVLTFSAVDSNGDSTNSTLTISFDDDIPVAIEPPTDDGGHPIPIVGGLVDEDDLPSGNHDSQPGDDDPVDAAADGDPTTTGGLAGSLAALFNAGADEPLTIGLNPDTTSLELQGLTSNGHALVYDVDVNTGVLTATADLNGNGVFDAGETIFTLTVNEDGSWVFNLEGQLDHSVPGFEDNINIDFGAIIVATDADGDSAIGAAGGLVVTVDDDLPTPIIPENPNEGQTPIPIIAGLVDEDDLPTGNHDHLAGDDEPGNLDGDNDGTTTGGNAPSLAGLFNGGADQPLSIVLSTDTSALQAQALTSKGGTIVYNVNAATGVLTGYVEAGGGAGYQEGVDRPVFTLTVNADGTWEFDLIDQLDHNPVEGAGTEDNILIDFSSVITAVDSDGDPATAAPGAFVINVDDDMPQPFDGCPDDVITINDVGSHFEGSLNLPPVGADEPGQVTFGVSDGDPVLDTEGHPVTSGGQALYYFINGDVLEAHAGDANGDVIFTITLNDDGTFDYDQLGPITSETELNITDLSSVGGGNVDAKVIDVDGSPFDLVLSTKSGTTVNTNATEIGIGAGQSFSSGEVLRVDLVQNSFASGSGGNVVLNFGEYYSANSYQQDVSGLSPGQRADFTVKAIAVNEAPGSSTADPADGDFVFYGDTNDTFVTGTTIALYDNNGVLVDPANYAGLGITVTALADGWQITGLPNDYDFKISSATAFNAVQIEAIAGTDTFKLGFIDITSVVQSEVDLSVPITFTDYDGDPVTCDIDVNLGPPSNTPNVTILVDEAALNDVGSNPGSTGETQGGDLSSLVTGGTGPYTFALVGSDGTSPYGTLTLNPDGTYSFTLTNPYDGQPDANNGTNVVPGVLTFTYEATDANNVTTQGTITVDIRDDVPTATDDLDSIALGGSTASGNVMTGVIAGSVTNDANATDGNADTFGADRPVHVSAITFNGTTMAVPDGGFTDIDGANGTLRIYSNGDYLYTRAGGSPGNSQDVFTYTIVDADGDTDQADLTITIADAPVTDQIPSDEAQTYVYENALGTNPQGTSEAAAPGANDDPNEVVTGSITFTAPDGLASISIGGTAINLANPFPQTMVDDATGKLEVLSVTFDPVTGNGSISYRYTLEDNTLGNQAVNGGNTTIPFAVDIVDSDGDHSPAGNLVITVVDDAPIAADDSNSVSEGASVNGTVLTNDLSGADGYGPKAVVGGVVGTNDAVDTQNMAGTQLVLVGTYGSLTLHSDGTYTYDANPNSNPPAGAHDDFTYTIRDGDGDLDSAVLTINVSDVTLTADNRDLDVYEKALDLQATGSDLAAASVVGSDPTDTRETVTGTLNVTGAVSYALNGSATGTHGIIQINSNGSFTYTLTSPVDGPTSDNGANEFNNVETFTYTATDVDGNTVVGTITIDVIDDIPTARNDVDSVTEDGPTLADGNVLTGSGGSDANLTDGVADTQGADGATVTGIKLPAAGAYAAVSTLPAGTQIVGTYGTLTIHDNGGYSYQLNNGAQNVQLLDQGEVVHDIFNYQITDGDGDTSTATIDISVTGTNDAPNVTGSTIAVSEEGIAEEPLPGARPNPDTVGIDDTTNLAVRTGSLTITDADGTTSWTIKLGTPSGSYTVDGVPVTWSLNGPANTVLTGSVAGLGTVITIELTNNTGGYQVTLLHALDQGGAANTETDGDITVPVTVSDGIATTNSSIVVTVEDDSPVFVSAVDATPDAGSDTSYTGQFNYRIGADEHIEWTTDHEIALTGVSGTVGTGNISLVGGSLQFVSANATTEVYTFDFTYAPNPAVPGTTVQDTATVTFDKSTGEYTVVLDDPIQSYSLSSVQQDATINFYGSLGGASQYAAAVASFNVGTSDEIHIQFTGDVADNTVPFQTTGVGTAGTYSDGDIFIGNDSWVSISSVAIAAGGNSLQSGNILDFNFYASNPGGTTGGAPTTSTEGAYILVDQLGSGEDMVLLLKLADPANPGTYTTRALIVDYADIYVEGEAVPAGYPVPGQNQGVIIVEQSDYAALVPAGYQLVGMQLMTSTEGITGSGYNFDGDVGSAAPVGTTAFDTNSNAAGTYDQDVIKILDIGIIQSTSNTEALHLNLDVTVTDADGDSFSQTLLVNPETTTLTTLAAAQTSTDTSSADSLSLLSANDNQEQQKVSGTNTVLMGALAAAGLATDPLAAHTSVTDGATDPQTASVATTDTSSVAPESTSSVESQRSGDALAGTGLSETDGGPQGGTSTADSQSAHGNALDAPQQDNSAPAELLQGTDAPSQGEAAAATPFTAPGIQMPAADQLVAKDGGAVAGDHGGAVAGDNVQHNAVVGQVLADALNGGDSPHIEAALNAVTGADHAAQAANDALASHGGQGVSNGDMPDLAAFIAAHGVGMVAPMEMHHDAPAAV